MKLVLLLVLHQGTIRTLGTWHVKASAKMPHAVLSVCSSHTVFRDLSGKQGDFRTLHCKQFLFCIETECYQQHTSRL